MHNAGMDAQRRDGNDAQHGDGNDAALLPKYEVAAAPL